MLRGMPDHIDLKPTEYRVKPGAFARWRQSRGAFLERHRKWMLRWATFAGVWLIALIELAPDTPMPKPFGLLYIGLALAPAVILAIVAIATDR